MSSIDTFVLNELKKIANDYMASIKGSDLKEIDLITAENLVLFGYLKAKDHFFTRNNDNKISKGSVDY